MFQCSLWSLITPSTVLPLLLAVGGGGFNHPNTVVQRADLIELNHCHDEFGRHCYDQIVFYEWSPDYRRYHVVAWCLVDNGLWRMPTFDRHKQKYLVRWHDRESSQQHEIWAPIFRESWSNSDPERANKKLMDEKYRVALLRQPQRRELY